MTWELLSNIIGSDPYTCAVYAKRHDLLKHLRMEAIEMTCKNRKKTHQNPQEVKIQTSQGIKKI